jgi:predicted dehydrogenase
MKTTASQPSRRRFLQSTLLAAAAPAFIPASAWSAANRPLPGDRITLGFIGMGKQNMGLLGRFMGKAETQVVAVCDVDTTRRENAKKVVEAAHAKRADIASYKGCADYNDFRELLAREDIDAVVIATPDHWHAPISIAAAKAGKDIYCEKPLCQSIFEARRMVEATRKHGRVFQVGSMQRSSREFRVACELVRNGVIGKMQRVEAGFGGPGKPCDLPEETMEAGLDWDLWLGPAPKRPYNSILSPRGVHNHFPAWRNYREYGGGGVTDWGAHHLDITHWGLGVDNGGPLEVVPPANADKASSGVKLLYPGGVEVTHISDNGVTFFGAEGEVHVNRGKIRVSVSGSQKAKYMGKEDQPALAQQLDALEREYLAQPKVMLYRSTDHYADFLNAMRTRKPPICDVEVGARTVTGCHLISLAYQHGQRMKWDAKKERFLNDAGSNKWLDVERRGPWKV